MPKLYQYTILDVDGSKKTLAPCKRKEFKGDDGVYKLAGATILQMVPKAYFPDDMNKRATAWADEEGLLNMKPKNPFFKTLHDTYFGETYIVGKVVLEEVFHGDI